VRLTRARNFSNGVGSGTVANLTQNSPSIRNSPDPFHARARARVERSRRNKVLDDGWKVVETITNEDLKPVV